MTAIGFDPGFGACKAAWITPSGELKTISVPSVVGVGSTELGLLGEMADPLPGRRARVLPLPERVAFGGVSYLVGEGVSAYTRPVERMDFLRLSGGSELQALFYTTLYRLLGPGEHRSLTLMVGLPVEVMLDATLARETRRELRRWILGEHRYTVNGEPVTLQVTALDVLAQPAGAYFGWLLGSDGAPARSAEEMKASVAICDIGYNTLDLLALQGGQVQARYTGGDTAGMRRAAEVVIGSVRRAHDLALSLHEADTLVRSRQPELDTATGLVDLSATTAQAREAVASAILALIERQWGKARQFRHVLFTGGGAEALRQTLTQHYPYGIVLPDAVTANAAGLAKAARRKAS